MANSYYQGQLVRVSLVFKDAAGDDADPTTVTARWRDPNGTFTAYVYGTDAELVKDATGRYHFDISTTKNGEYRYRGEGTSAVQATAEGRFAVAQSPFLVES